MTSYIDRKRVEEMLDHQIEWWKKRTAEGIVVSSGTFDQGYLEALCDVVMDIRYLDFGDRYIDD